MEERYRINIYATLMNLKDFIRDIPDFPKPGITFKDISPLLSSPEALAEVIDQLMEKFKNMDIAAICGIDSRGFIFGSLLAQKMHLPFCMIRKKGKLPGKIISESYELEYGTDALEIQQNILKENDHVLLVDDVLATGGTMKAACKLIEKCGAHVAGIGLLMELAFLNGRNQIQQYNISALIQYSDEHHQFSRSSQN